MTPSPSRLVRTAPLLASLALAAWSPPAHAQLVPWQPVAPNAAPGARQGTATPIPTDGLRAEPFALPDGRRGWRLTIPGSRPLATPAVVDGVVYAGGGFGSHEFYALDARTGAARWAIRVSDDGPTAAVVADGVVAFNTESCTLFVVDAATGRMLWSRWLGDPLMSQPAIADGAVYMAFPSPSGHRLIALGLRDGRERWQAPIAGDIISAPVVDGDSVYLATFDGNVYRFRTRDGSLVWREDFHATSAPWLFEGRVLVSRREDTPATADAGAGPAARAVPTEGVASMSGATGAMTQSHGLWNRRRAAWLDRDVQRSSAYRATQSAVDTSVGFGTGPATARLAEAENNVGQGTVHGLWEFQGSRPCVVGGRLFMTQGDRVVALDPRDGRALWTRDLQGVLESRGGALAAPPSPAGHELYVATVTGQIVVLAQDDGRVLRTVPIGGEMRFQPAIADGWLFAATTHGVLVSVELGDARADGWRMWGGGPAHNGAIDAHGRPLAPAPSPAPARPRAAGVAPVHPRGTGWLYLVGAASAAAGLAGGYAARRRRRGAIARALPAAPPRFAPGDACAVTIEGRPEWSGAFTVTDDGTIELPGVGLVFVEGATEAHAADAVRAALCEHTASEPAPHVTVSRRDASPPPDAA